MPFTIVEHARERIIEVVYPPEPTAGDVADYTFRIKKLIDAQTEAWSCLVDQRAVKMLDTKIVEKIGLLNSYAQKRGMRRAARLVSSSVASLQASRIADAGDLKVQVRTFYTRDEAVAWLKE
jgi:hypothetical protein